jgi:putative membrane protein
LSSTSSRDQNEASATETLASRYRHLFVLPSAPRLLTYGGLASLCFVLVSLGTSGLISFIPAFAVFILSAAAISSALRLTDRKSIATMRRVSALLLVGELLWLVMVSLGAASSWVTGAPRPLNNAILYGSFICAGLEFLIINGAFAKSAGLSLALAALHPAATFAIVRYGELVTGVDSVPLALGAASLALIIAFPLSLQRQRTSLGHDSLSLFRAFMKTWTVGHPDDLEDIIADHSEKATVTTKVLRFKSRSSDVLLVLPGVHPGPFYPIGSYDLPGVIGRTFGSSSQVMTLHKPGGHERNLATRADTQKYAEMVKDLAVTIVPRSDQALVRGPVSAQISKAKASLTSFSQDSLMTISFAPLGSDDLDTTVETELAKAAATAGLKLSVVDAHNSIDHDLESPTIGDPGWKELLARGGSMKGAHFNIAYAHSAELGFKGGSDLTENGIGLFMIQAGATKSVLILADANNAVPSLREAASKALESAGYHLIEFCTSDSHNLAARGMTVERGYQALGEDTPVSSLADIAVKLAQLSEPRLSQADYGSAESSDDVRVFGSKALNEFAAITQASSRYARRYSRVAVTAVAVLFLASILL